MKILLDTHVLLWALADAPQLTERARTILLNPQNEICFSVVSLWEIQIKHALHPQEMPEASLVLAGTKEAGFSSLPLNTEEILRLRELPPLHKDPFDRILMSQAETYGMKFLTVDGKILQYQLPSLLRG